MHLVKYNSSGKLVNTRKYPKEEILRQFNLETKGAALATKNIATLANGETLVLVDIEGSSNKEILESAVKQLKQHKKTLKTLKESIERFKKAGERYTLKKSLSESLGLGVKKAAVNNKAGIPIKPLQETILDLYVPTLRAAAKFKDFGKQHRAKKMAKLKEAYPNTSKAALELVLKAVTKFKAQKL